MTITVGGTSITFNDSTTQSTAGLTSAVTSVATGNGLSGGTITTTGTLTIAAPSANTVGSYVIGILGSFSGCINFFFGSNYTAAAQDSTATPKFSLGTKTNTNAQGPISGTWKWMAKDGVTAPCGGSNQGIAVRVS